MLQDLRFAFRLLRRSPGFALASVLTLALGIGATTAIFTLTDAVLLRPLHIPADDRVVALQQSTRQGPGTAFLYNQYTNILAATSGTMNIAIEYGEDVFVETSSGLARRHAGFVSANYFDVLKRQPARGRPFTATDDHVGAEPVVIVGNAFWRTILNGDAQVVGRTLRVARVNMTIVGVAAPGVRGTDLQNPDDLFLPAHVVLATTMLAPSPGNYYFEDGSEGWSPGAWWHVFARLTPGATIESAARSAVCAVCDVQKLQLISIQQAAVASRIRGDVSRFAAVLFASVCLVLLIGCANLAGLALARTESRRREIAVRLALGISRTRLARQIVWECLLIAAGGAIVGTVLARWLLAGLTSFELPGFVPLGAVEYPLDVRIIAFTIAASVLSGIAFGVAPARAASRTDILRGLKDAGGGTAVGRSRYVLIGAQVAFTIVLVFGAGLFIRSLQAALTVNIGLDSTRVIVADVDARAARLGAPQKVAYYAAAVSQLQSLPGVERVSYGNGPFFLFGMSTPQIGIDGQSVLLPRNVPVFQVGPGYFQTLGIPLVRGRDVTTADDPTADSVVVVNDAFARRFWPGQDPLGHHVSVPPVIKDAAVVGVSADGKYGRLDEPAGLAIFGAWKQGVPMAPAAGLIVRAIAGEQPSLPAIRQVLGYVDAEVPVRSVLPLREIIDRAVLPQKMGFWLLGSFGAVALLLAVVGVHGLVAYLVSQRTREIGVRMALGADRGDITRLVVSGLFVAVAGGAAAGTAAVWWLGRFVDRLLFGVTPRDPEAFAITLGLLALAAIAGSYVPIRRATRVDPMVALRAE